MEIAALALALLAGAPARAGENMIGRQSQNEGMVVVPAPEPVTVDGDLADWDFSGRIWVFADQAIRNRYSTETAAMWDADALYVAVKWRDPTPMHNTIDPAFNPESGWKSDSVQMRVSTPDQTSWFTTWYFEPQQQPVFHAAIWKSPTDSRTGTDEHLYIAPAGGTKLGEGIEMAYRKNEDGAGFVQEIRIPWKRIYKNPPAIAADLVFRLGFEFLWGDPTGNTWPVHRYADNLQPGQTSREFFWTAYKAWGDAKLQAAGKVPLRRYVSDTSRVEGALPIRLDIPRSAARVTFVIESEAGGRVRNLGGDLLPEDYTIAETETTRTIQLGWDGLDDHGKLVAPGTYRVRGLYHGGLGAEYEMCFYNPGTPPWPTADGGSAWGADHCPPLRAARAGDSMIVSWAFAEGGSGIIGVGADGRKKWGEKRGATLLAGDEAFVYGVPAGWHIEKDVLIRLDRKNGSYSPFTRDGAALPFELPFADILGNDDNKPAALVATDRQLVILLQPKRPAGPAASAQGSRLAFVDKATAKLDRLLETRSLSLMTAAADGAVFAADATNVYRLDPATGAATLIAAAGLVTPAALAVDNAGNIVVMDAGPDYQVKAYGAAGELKYTCGRKGGRPIRGDFDPQAMRAVSSIAVDVAGNVWVVESWDYPRRVSVWNPKDGTLVRDYIGNTGYAGTGCYLHDSDTNLAYVGPIELRLDKTRRVWSVSRVLWVPDRDAGESFRIGPGEHAQPQRFTATVRGKPHEYMFVPPYRDYEGYKLFMETAKGWQPVCAITTVGQISGSTGDREEENVEPSGEFAGLHLFDAVFWNDRNGDAKVQRAECEIVQPATPRDARRKREIPLPLGSGWGERMAPDFTFYANGLVRYRPIEVTEEGAPLFGPASLERLGVDERGDLIPVPEEDLVLCLSFKNYASACRIAGIDTRSGAVRWDYPNPYPGVHGSHRAPMPTPGMVVGPLKIVGVASINDEVGRVFAMRGNLGQDFFMTTDGLFVGAMFQDGRLPGESLPNKEESLIGMPMENYSHGGEPFNGWLGKQADGKVRMTTGFPRQAAMILAVNGLDSVRRFTAAPIAVTADRLAEADRDNQARAARAAPPTVYSVKTLATPPRMDGRDNDWADVAEAQIQRAGFPSKGSARLAVDSTNLYMCYTVADESPWRNEGKDFTRLFKTGDAVDLQLCTDSALAADAKRSKPGAADVRIVLSQLDGKPTAVLMRPVDPTAGTGQAVDFTSPVGTMHFDRIEVLNDAVVKVSTSAAGYTVEASIPLATLGLKPAKGMKLRGDFGFISSDTAGRINAARTYWANKDTNLVSDLPQEAWLFPATWGEFIFE